MHAAVNTNSSLSQFNLCFTYTRVHTYTRARAHTYTNIYSMDPQKVEQINFIVIHCVEKTCSVTCMTTPL